MKRRVVITGMGIYSCLGKNLDEVSDALYNGKSGIILDRDRKEMGFRSGLTAYLELPNLKGILSRNQRVNMAEQGCYAYLATVEALKNAKLEQDYPDTHEVGILYGNDSCAEPVVESVDIMREKKDTTLIGSGSIFKSMNSTVSMNLSCIFKLKGINLT
ncbi:MAG: beta-ketoacyl-[acyl-carrier-protein] synthase family protein, partial [Prevotellaceae bacterium]|nr:beta-ketoacyl-[acyl-carrier-protein] synthase family protein [Prevotellaceae bacterium]